MLFSPSTVQTVQRLDYEVLQIILKKKQTSFDVAWVLLNACDFDFSCDFGFVLVFDYIIPGMWFDWLFLAFMISVWFCFVLILRIIFQIPTYCVFFVFIFVFQPFGAILREGRGDGSQYFLRFLTRKTLPVCIHTSPKNRFRDKKCTRHPTNNSDGYKVYHKQKCTMHPTHHGRGSARWIDGLFVGVAGWTGTQKDVEQILTWRSPFRSENIGPKIATR